MLVKRSKCAFGVSQIDYMGKVISAQGVAMEEHKVSTVLRWPQQKTIKSLKEFLDLTGYYRRFIKGYGAMPNP